MTNKHSRGLALLACVLSVTWLLGATVVARAANPVPVESWNFELLGSVDTADDGTPTKSRAYSKIAPWPFTEHTFFNTGCYESGITPAMPGCFRVVDVKNPWKPERIATVEVYDRVKSPLPPVPSAQYWKDHPDLNVWTNSKFDNLTFSTACGDWAVDANGNHIGPGWHDTQANPTCWDKGWITRTHYTAGASGYFQQHDYFDPGHGRYKKNRSIYWVNSQRQSGAPAKRLGYTGVGFYDLSNPYQPQFLSRIDLDPGRNADGTYFDPSGVHHGFFDGRYAYFGGGEAGIIGHHLIIVDAKDPENPKIVGRWWVPGQKTPEEDAIRNSTAIDPQTGLQKGWIPGNGFAPIHTDQATGLLTKDVSFHWIEVRRIEGRDIAFISWHEAGLIILDVTDKRNPKFLSRFDYLTPAFQAADMLPGAQEDYATCKAQVKPTWSGDLVACGNAHSGKIVPGTNNKIFWLTDEYFTLPYGHLRMFDVSNLKKPKLLSHLVLPQNIDTTITYAERTASTHLGNAWNSDLLFMAWYGLGVKAINISNPKHPYLVGSYSYVIDNGKGGQATYDVIFDHEGNLAVTDSVDGVRVLRYTGPGSHAMHRGGCGYEKEFEHGDWDDR
jgi:hypothetical protein